MCHPKDIFGGFGNHVAKVTTKIILNMATHSVKSTSTVRTIDDVFSQLDLEMPEATLAESRKYIKKITSPNHKLEMDSIEKLHDPNVHLSPLAPDTNVLLKHMSKYKAVLGGIQATAFFYPVCGITGAPWDFFCDAKKADEFINRFPQVTNAELLEDLCGDSGHRVAYFRKNVSGFDSVINIRVFVSESQPIASILDLKCSYEQACISICGAVFFWPKLQQRGLYRSFDSNIGLTQYPRGKSIHSIHTGSMKKTTLKRPSEFPSVYTGIVERVEAIVFSSKSKSVQGEMDKEVRNLQEIVYAVHNTSTRYLGTVGDMV